MYYKFDTYPEPEQPARESKTVKDFDFEFNEENGWGYVDQDQEVREIVDDIGLEDEDFNFLFVRQMNGERLEIWGGTGIPYLEKQVWKLL